MTSARSFTSSATLTYETDTLIEGYLSRGSINLNHKSSHYLNAVSNPANKVDSVTTTLANGGSVSLVGFGTFSVKARAARAGRNPRTGETIQIPASNVPGFKAGKALKDAVN